jgi:hypothetical protein
MPGFTTPDRENKFSCSDSLHGQERQVAMRRFMILNKEERLSCSDFSHKTGYTDCHVTIHDAGHR